MTAARTSPLSPAEENWTSSHAWRDVPRSDRRYKGPTLLITKILWPHQGSHTYVTAVTANPSYLGEGLVGQEFCGAHHFVHLPTPTGLHRFNSSA